MSEDTGVDLGDISFDTHIVKLVVQVHRLQDELRLVTNAQVYYTDKIDSLRNELQDERAANERQKVFIDRTNDELWALREELRLTKERVKFNSYDRLQLDWYQRCGFVIKPEEMEPFGVKDDVLVDPMDGDKIPTIKLVRELTGLGLKDAKDIVDKWEADGKFKKWSAE